MTDEDRVDDLLLLWEEHRRGGRDVSAEELCHEGECPHLVGPVARGIAELEKMVWLDQPPPGVDEAEPPTGRGRPRTAATSGFGEGDELVPGYRLIERLGKGAFGEVWSASHMLRRYAIKILYGGADLSQIEREGLARLTDVVHPHILTRFFYHSYGSTLALVTELADGSLKRHFEDLRRRLPRLRVYAEALFLLRDAAGALDYLQARHDLMHLDVKPANLLLVYGRCKLGDFGTVRPVPNGADDAGVVLYLPSEEDGAEATTVRYGSLAEVPWDQALRKGVTLFSGGGVFSPAYAPPEAFEGKSSRSFDQYSLAVTFCELVADVLPFPGQDTAQQLRDRRAGVLDLEFLPKVLRPALERALEAQPRHRFASCVEFIEALRDALRPLVRKDAEARARLEDWPVSGAVRPKSRGKVPTIPPPVPAKSAPRRRRSRLTFRSQVSSLLYGLAAVLLAALIVLAAWCQHSVRHRWIANSSSVVTLLLGALAALGGWSAFLPGVPPLVVLAVTITPLVAIRIVTWRTPTPDEVI
jgi:serine/threonine protein kinase